MNHVAKHGIAKEKLQHKRPITLFAIGGLINVLTRNTATLVRGRKFGPVIALGLVVSSICLGWSVLPSSAPQLERGLFLAYGPADFVRSAGKPAPDIRNFSLPNTQTEYRLQIFNGGLNSQFAGASSALVTVNGRQIASPADFNQNVRLIERALVPATANSLAVELRSGPKTGLTLRVVGVDTQPPTITAAAAPSANALGWNNTNVTVSFSCGDSISGIENCPSPVTVTGEGAAQLVTGTATDRAQNSSEASLTINLDKTSPVLNVTSPANGAVVSDPTLNVNGTVSDPLSGVTNITCDGAAASLSGASFTCVRPLNPGQNSIVVEAMDRAGNHTSTTLNVTRSPEVVEEEVSQIKGVRLAPDVIFVGESEPVTVSARIPYDHTSGAPQVTLQRIDAAGNVLGVEGLLRDNGDAEQGDLLAGDGLFSFRRTYAPESPEQLRFRVAYQREGAELKSDALQLGFYHHLTDEQIESIKATQLGAGARYQSLLATLGKGQAVETLLAELRQNPTVLQATVDEEASSISILYAPGILGGLSLDPPGTRGGGTSSASSLIAQPTSSFRTPQLQPQAAEEGDEEDDENRIGNKRVLILSPFRDQFEPLDEGQLVVDQLSGSECPTYNVEYYSENVGVNYLWNLDSYGVIVIVSHGDMQNSFNHPGSHRLPPNSYMFALSMRDDINAQGVFRLHEKDLVAGRLAIRRTISGSYFAALPNYIEYYTAGEMPKSLVYVAACHSLKNSTMAQAFIGRGAQTYFGYSKAVASDFAYIMALNFMTDYFGATPHTTGGPDGAFKPGQIDPTTGAEFKMFGSETLNRPSPYLTNGNFEKGSLEGWGFFESTAVSQLGDIQPESGDYMGMVFKNTMKNYWFGNLHQEFCLTTEVTRIEFDWNFITEQQCDSLTSSPDALQVRLTVADYYELYHPVLDTDVEKLCSQFRPTTIDLPSEGTARATGWQHASIDITEVAQRMNGKKVYLVFELTSWGQHMDRTTDSAVLIDNIKIVTETDAP